MTDNEKLIEDERDVAEARWPVEVVGFDDYGSRFTYESTKNRELREAYFDGVAAGLLRRSEIPEPIGYRAILIKEARAEAEHWRAFDDTEDLVGTLIGMANMLAADASPAQGEPSAAQVKAALEAFGDVHPWSEATLEDRLRAALRAAGGVR